jgi:hypothetical protein
VFQVTRDVTQVQSAFDAPHDHLAPRLSFPPAPARLSGAAIPFSPICDETCRMRVNGTVSLPGGAAAVFRLKPVTRSLSPGAKTRILLRLPAQAVAPLRKALARHRRVVARLTVVLRDRRGNQHTRRVVLKLRR